MSIGHSGKNFILASLATMLAPIASAQLAPALIVASGSADTQVAAATLEENLTLPVPVLFTIDATGRGAVQFDNTGFAGLGLDIEIDGIPCSTTQHYANVVSATFSASGSCTRYLSAGLHVIKVERIDVSLINTFDLRYRYQGIFARDLTGTLATGEADYVELE